MYDKGHYQILRRQQRIARTWAIPGLTESAIEGGPEAFLTRPRVAISQLFSGVTFWQFDLAPISLIQGIRGRWARIAPPTSDWHLLLFGDTSAQLRKHAMRRLASHLQFHRRASASPPP
jgi:hypothetical protein